MAKLRVTVGTITDRGLNPRRTANEDRFLSIPEEGICVVADGVGGHRGGQTASQMAIDSFAEAFNGKSRPDLVEYVRKVILATNQAIYQKSVSVPELNGMASTIALVAFDDQRAVIAHVGDSRVYRFNGQRLLLETEDHSEVNDALRAGKITRDQAERHPNKNIISRALGADSEVEPEIKVVELTADTSFLLCTDGINRHLSDSELERLLSQVSHPSNTCLKMKDICHSRGAEDNLTAVILDFGERVYEDEPTRPVLVRGAGAGVSGSATPSRISVDFGEVNDGPALKSPGQPTKTPGQRRARSYVSGAIQLAILATIIAAVFLVGRRWDEVWRFVTGRPVVQTPGQPVLGDPQALPPASPDLAAARSLFDEKRFEKARESFLELTRKDAANPEYRFWLGRSCLELKQYAEAITNLDAAAKADPKLPGVFIYLAMAYEGRGDKKNAAESLRRAGEFSAPPSPSSTPAG